MSAACKEKQKYLKQKQRLIDVLSSPSKTLDYQLMRTIIITTHQLQEGSSLWEARQCLTLTNRNSAWKFCLLLHKLLIDGHVEVCKNAILHIEELKRIHGHWSRESVRKPNVSAQNVPITLYCGALIFKLQFHQNYTIFNGDLSLKGPQEWKADVCFQILADVLDLLEVFLLLGNGMQHEKEMLKKSAKNEDLHHLTPFSTLLTECTALYSLAGEFLNKLAKSLHYDYVVGFEIRFENISMQLKNWFAFLHCRNLPIETWIDDQENRNNSIQNVQSTTIGATSGQLEQRHIYAPTAPDLEF